MEAGCGLNRVRSGRECRGTNEGRVWIRGWHCVLCGEKTGYERNQMCGDWRRVECGRVKNGGGRVGVVGEWEGKEKVMRVKAEKRDRGGSGEREWIGKGEVGE